MTQAFRDQVKEEYRFLAYDELLIEKDKQQKIIEDQTKAWETTNLALPIVGVIFGFIFSVVLIGIPLVVFSIISIVDKSKLRNKANIAINRARARIEIIDSLLGKAKHAGDPIEVEVVDKHD